MLVNSAIFIISWIVIIINMKISCFCDSLKEKRKGLTSVNCLPIISLKFDHKMCIIDGSKSVYFLDLTLELSCWLIYTVYNQLIALMFVKNLELRILFSFVVVTESRCINRLEGIYKSWWTKVSQLIFSLSYLFISFTIEFILYFLLRPICGVL